MIGTIGIVSATMEISTRPGILQCESREAQDNDRPMYLKLSMDIAQDKRVVEIGFYQLSDSNLNAREYTCSCTLHCQDNVSYAESRQTLSQSAI